MKICLFPIIPHRVQYQFEDEPFDTVPDLITFYVGSGKVISAASGNINSKFLNIPPNLEEKSIKPFKTFFLSEIKKVLEFQRHAIVSARSHTTRVNTEFPIAQATQASEVMRV